MHSISIEKKTDPRLFSVALPFVPCALFVCSSKHYGPVRRPPGVKKWTMESSPLPWHAKAKRKYEAQTCFSIAQSFFFKEARMNNCGGRGESNNYTRTQVYPQPRRRIRNCLLITHDGTRTEYLNTCMAHVEIRYFPFAIPKNWDLDVRGTSANPYLELAAIFFP